MKSFFIVFLMLIGLSTTSRAELEAFQVGNEKLNCKALNGVTITSNKTNPSTVRAKLGMLSSEFAFDINPGFYTWTWISMAKQGQITAQEYQIFLVGNAPAGKEVTLHGWIGRMVSVPAPGFGGMLYPMGFIPQSVISCQVYWENVLGHE